MNIKRYIITFIITAIIFTFSFWISGAFANRKVQSLKNLEDKINLEILSLETRFSILQKTSCEYAVENKSIGFNKDLNEVAARMKSIENQLGYENEDVIYLKKFYSLIQIKDYLLAKEFHDRCKQDIVSILYFYDEACAECAKQALVLDKIKFDYPEVRVYYLDSSLDTPALKTLVSLYDIEEAPTMVINDKVYKSFQDIDKLENYIPEITMWKINNIKNSQNISTSTSSTSSDVITSTSTNKSLYKKRY